MKTYCTKCKKGVKKCVCPQEKREEFLRIIRCDFCANPATGKKIAFDGYTANHCDSSECKSHASWATSRV